jgi:FAD/FMN-containing dehydrogenase
MIMTGIRITTTSGQQVVLAEGVIEEFEHSLRGEILRHSDDGYDEARAVYNAMIDRHPSLIVLCAGAADVINSVNFARTNQLLVAVRGAGHNVGGFAVCDGGIVIDLSQMKGMRIDPPAQTVRADPGLTWGELNQDLQVFGLAATGGFVSTTGIGGLTLGGGLGWLVRKHGLACDNLLSVDIVTADGRLLMASSTQNQDLFWGVRGSGGNLGVVTSFEFKVHPLSTTVGGQVIHPVAKAREALRFWRDFAASAPEDLTDGAVLLNAPPAPFIPVEAQGTPVVGIYAVCTGPIDAAEQIIQPLREFGPPMVDTLQAVPFMALQTMIDGAFPPGFHNYWKSSFLKGLSDEAIDTVLTYFARIPSPMSAIVLEHNGDGAMNRVSETETSFGHRDWSYNLLIVSMWDDPADAEINITWTREFWEAMKPYTSERVYVNYLGDEGEDRVKAAYAAPTYKRLVALKNRYDPGNLFRLNQNIKPTNLLNQDIERESMT